MESNEERQKEPPHDREKAAATMAGDPKTTTRAAARSSVLWSGCLLATTVLVGVALMAFWAVAFHAKNEQLWMVPVSLIMVVTPLLVWLSAASDSYLHKAGPLLRRKAETPPAAAVVPMDRDPER